MYSSPKAQNFRGSSKEYPYQAWFHCQTGFREEVWNMKSLQTKMTYNIEPYWEKIIFSETIEKYIKTKYFMEIPLPCFYFGCRYEI
jgi:hypothetical protein